MTDAPKSATPLLTAGPPPPEAQSEIEVRLALPNPDAITELPGMLAACGLSVGFARRCRVRDTYLDTADWWLYRAGIACRLREADDVSLELKTLAPARRGLSIRREFCETLAAAPSGRIDRLPGETIRAWLEPLMPHPAVAAKMHLVQDRVLYDAASADGTAFRASADTVRVNDAEPYVQIELELLEGAEQALRNLGDTFCKQFGLAPADGSKFERGLILVGLAPPVSPETVGYRLTPGDRFVEAACKVLHRNFERFRWNEPATRLGIDPAGLHDMRVATRRMRSALKHFREALPPRSVRGFRRDLKWVAAALGRVRDLDVYLQDLDARVASLPERRRSATGHYHDALQARRDVARKALLRTLSTQRFADFVGRMTRFLDVGPAGRAKAGRAMQPVAEAAAATIEGLYDKTLAQGRGLDKHSPDEALHAMRIRCKQLRYVSEFFEELYGAPAAAFIERVRRIQRILGDHQDAVVAQAMIEAFVSHSPATGGRGREALGRLIAIERKNAARTRAGYFKTWSGFDRKRTWRRLGKALKGLRP